MKIYIQLFCFFLLIGSSTINAQIPDGNFEQWTTNSIGRLDLQSWNTGNLLYDRASTLQEIGRSGSGYSAKLISVYDSTVGYYEGGTAILMQFPFSGPVRPGSVLGYWKTLNPGFDAAVFAEVYLYDAGLNLIGQGGRQTPFGLTLSAWTSFTIPITYTTNDPVAFYDLTFTWYNFGTDSTAHAYLDDVSFDVSTEVSVINKKQEISVSTLSNAVYKLKSKEYFSENYLVKIYDINGKLVSGFNATEQQNPSDELLIDLSSMASGIYYCKIFDADRISTVKLLR